MIPRDGSGLSTEHLQTSRAGTPRTKSRRAVAIQARGGNAVAGGRGPVAEAIVAAAAERGIAVRRDGDLAEVLSALDPATASSDAAAALTAALLDRLYWLNDAVKAANQRASKRESI